MHWFEHMKFIFSWKKLYFTYKFKIGPVIRSVIKSSDFHAFFNSSSLLLILPFYWNILGCFDLLTLSLVLDCVQSMWQ